MSVKSQLDQQAFLEREKSAEYLMIKSLTASNFKCFKQVELTSLRWINVVVGRNASGKTALLELIKLALEGTPATIPWLNQMRNMATIMPIQATGEQFQGQFRDFFYEFNTENAIEVVVHDSTQRTAALRVYFDAKRATTLPLGFQAGAIAATSPSRIVPLAFDRTDFNGRKTMNIATLNNQGQPQFSGRESMGMKCLFFSNIYFGNPSENAAWLSALSVDKRDAEISAAIRKHFPFIAGVGSETPFAGAPAIVYADIPTLPRKVPLSLVSGGISRLFTIILGIVTGQGGVVIVDELENGIFYDQYPLIWQSLADIAREHKTQLFISTHSGECLEALLPTIRGNENDFSLLRAEKENGASRISQFTGVEFEGALAKGGEIRRP